MTDEPRQQRLDEQTMSTGILPGSGEAWPPVPVEPEAPAYVKEPLFSKKVLAGWAIGTLMVWFAITVVVPEIVRTVKSEISARIAEPRVNAAGETVYETPRGTFMITRDPDGTIRIKRIPPGDAAAAPAVTVPAPQIDPAPPAPAPTN